MSILSGIKKVIPYFKNADGNYEQLSYKTSSQTVDFDDGKTAETKLGAIKGITTSTSVTETGYAADAKTVSEINQSLESFNVDNLSYKDLAVDTSNKTVSFKPDIRDVKQGLLVITGALTNMQTHFTVICGVNSEYNDITDIYKDATNGWVDRTDKNIIIHSNHNVNASNPLVTIRMRLFA